MKAKSLKILKSLQNKNGLFSASAMQVSTGYNRAWIRDNVYAAIGLENYDIKASIKTYQALLDIIKKHEFKVDWAIKEKPDARFKYIHARYDLETMDEIWDEWGDKQNDAVGSLLFKIGELTKKGHTVLRDINDYRIIQKLVFYLKSVEFWHDEDNGMWEENEEVHASSVGACLAGLLAVKDLVYVPEDLLKKGQNTLNNLLPRESISKEVDLAQLSLIYPYNVVTEKQRNQILNNVEKYLVRDMGVIRYENDAYYNENGEAEWTFGFPWLAIIYKQLNNKEKYELYMKKTEKVMNDDFELPELYFSGTRSYNNNTPLAWSQAMYLVALHERT